MWSDPHETDRTRFGAGAVRKEKPDMSDHGRLRLQLWTIACVILACGATARATMHEAIWWAIVTERGNVVACSGPKQGERHIWLFLPGSGVTHKLHEAGSNDNVIALTGSEHGRVVLSLVTAQGSTLTVRFAVVDEEAGNVRVLDGFGIQKHGLENVNFGHAFMMKRDAALLYTGLVAFLGAADSYLALEPRGADCRMQYALYSATSLSRAKAVEIPDYWDDSGYAAFVLAGISQPFGESGNLLAMAEVIAPDSPSYVRVFTLDPFAQRAYIPVPGRIGGGRRAGNAIFFPGQDADEIRVLATRPEPGRLITLKFRHTDTGVE